MKSFAREVYILTRHCHFNPEYLYGVTPYLRHMYLDLWNEEQEEVKRQMEDAKNKSKGMTSAGGPMSRGVKPYA